MMMLVNTYDVDGMNTEYRSYWFEVEEEIDFEAAVKKAVTDFVHTEEGEKIYQANNQCFNWGDVDCFLPNEICKKYGFCKCKLSYDEINVSFNQHLVLFD